MAAARWWARGGKPAAVTVKPSAGAAKVAADLAAFGAPKDLVGRWSALAAGSEEEDTPLFKVRRDCWNTVRLFCLLETQWAWVGMGLAGATRTGLRYEVAPVTARLSRIALTPALFDGLRTMEIAALDELADIAREDAERLKRDDKPKTRKRKRGK